MVLRVVVFAGNIISIHALREEGDKFFARYLIALSVISIHALREEGDRLANVPTCRALIFLSTPSARRATLPASIRSPMFFRFLSTPSARRATAVPLCSPP